ELRFERRPLVEKILGERGEFRRGIIPRMLDDSLTHLKGEIQSRKIEIPLLELLDDPQRVQIVVEAVAMLPHTCVELPFSGVPEWRMADVVDEGKRFGEIGVQLQSARYRARDLCNFQRVREPVAKVIGKASREYLRFRFETAERAGMDYAVAVAGVVIAIRMPRLGVAPSARALHIHCIGFE